MKLNLLLMNMFLSVHAEVVIIDRSFHPVTNDEVQPVQRRPSDFLLLNSSNYCCRSDGSSVSSHAAKCLFCRNVIAAGLSLLPSVETSSGSDRPLNLADTNTWSALGQELLIGGEWSRSRPARQFVCSVSIHSHGQTQQEAAHNALQYCTWTCTGVSHYLKPDVVLCSSS